MTDAILHIDFFWYDHVKWVAFTLIEFCVLGHLSTRQTNVCAEPSYSRAQLTVAQPGSAKWCGSTAPVLLCPGSHHGGLILTSSKIHENTIILFYCFHLMKDEGSRERRRSGLYFLSWLLNLIQTNPSLLSFHGRKIVLSSEYIKKDR